MTKYTKTIIGNERYAENYFNIMQKKQREENSNIEKVLYFFPFKFAERKEADAVFTITVIYK